MRAVNLLPADARPAGRFAGMGGELSSRRILPIGGIAAGVAAVLFGVAYFHERSVVSSKHSDLARAQGQLAAAQAEAAVIRQAQAEVSSRFAFVNSVVNGRANWDRVLGDLARTLPGGVYLSSLQAASAGSAAASAAATSTTSTSTVTPSATTFTISGSTSSHARVALVLDRLAVLPWLSGITLASSTRQSDGTVQFSLSAGFQPGGGS